jgi:hypothetical protein
MERIFIWCSLGICSLLSIWDLMTGTVGIAAGLSKTHYSSNIIDVFREVLNKNPAYIFMGIFFAFFVVMSDYFLMKASEEKIWTKAEYKKLFYVGLFFWTIFKAVDFSTTVVGTTQFTDIRLPEGADIITVWQVVTADSWGQMILLLVLSTMTTLAHISIALLIKLLEALK